MLLAFPVVSKDFWGVFEVLFGFPCVFLESLPFDLIAAVLCATVSDDTFYLPFFFAIYKVQG